MENCTEAFKMIILRLSECNCMECQDTFYHLDKCGKDMVLRNSLIVLEKMVHMLNISAFLETVCRNTKARYKRQMSNISNFVACFYFVV